MFQDLFHRAYTCLQTNDVDSKLAMTTTLAADWECGTLTLQNTHSPVAPIAEPGRPDQPALVSALHVAQRKVSSPTGRAALIHSIAHIEFNAINLALDAVYRFRGLPREYYGDWLKVAAEEAYHFTLLRDHLRSLGYDYGSFSAHNGLWEMAVRTAHDPLVRMALVPRVLEARGLDVTPVLIHKMASGGDKRAVEILEIILRDEVGHVRIGNHWYTYLCAQRGIEPMAMFRTLLQEYNAQVRPPFHTEARLAAGFSEEELQALERLSKTILPQ